MRRVANREFGSNPASYVGATLVRHMVPGDDDHACGPAELERLKALVRDAMREMETKGHG